MASAACLSSANVAGLLYQTHCARLIRGPPRCAVLARGGPAGAELGVWAWWSPRPCWGCGSLCHACARHVLTQPVWLQLRAGRAGQARGRAAAGAGGGRGAGAPGAARARLRLRRRARRGARGRAGPRGAHRAEQAVRARAGQRRTAQWPHQAPPCLRAYDASLCCRLGLQVMT